MRIYNGKCSYLLKARLLVYFFHVFYEETGNFDHVVGCNCDVVEPHDIKSSWRSCHFCLKFVREQAYITCQDEYIPQIPYLKKL